MGREKELRRLAALVDGDRSVVVLGEAGVGKTALLREAAAASDRDVMEGGALATLSWMPYLPLSRALGRDALPGDAEFVAGEVERAVGPGILLLDDLQWSDRSTRATLPFLIGRITMLVAVRRGDPAENTALRQLVELGFDVVEVEPLGEEDAAALVRKLRPKLSDPAAAVIARRGGGIPLVLEELAATGGASESLKRSIGSRLRALSPAAREAVETLAIAGRPLRAEAFDDGVDEAIAAGIAAEERGEVAIRHALLSEVVLEELDHGARMALHAKVARLVEDAGEAARHHAAAGERDAAFRTALEAVDRASLPGERATHLALAASLATGSEADLLRLRAAAALDEIKDHERTEEILDAIESEEPLMVAEASLFRCRARDEAGDLDGARTALAVGLAAASGTGSEIEVRLRIEEAQMIERFDPEHSKAAVAKAQEAVRLARTVGHRERSAGAELAIQRLYGGARTWEADLEDARLAARRDGDDRIELRATNTLIFGRVLNGRPKAAREVAEEAAVRARDQRRTAWERRFRGWLVGADWHGGRPARAAAEGEELLEEILSTTDRRFISFYTAQALIDLGRFEAARTLVDAMVADSVPDPSHGASVYEEEPIEALWALANLELWAGRPREALAAVERCFAMFGERSTYEGSTAFLHIVRAWASFDLGRTPDVATLPRARRLTEAAPTEQQGLARLDDDPREAAELLGRAAALWRGRHVPGEVRCLWAQGEALRRGNAEDAARRSLVKAERRALEGGYRSLLARIHRSLRLVGVRRSAPRTLDETGLTGREREVLDLAASGLANDEIARRLGVGRPTVARLIASASTKLGATSRRHAVAISARR